MSIEQAMVEKQVFAGLAAGNQVLKELHKEMSLADVEKLMDETADSIAYQNEIDELLSTRLSVADEEDIERELDLMVVSCGRKSCGQIWILFFCASGVKGQRLIFFFFFFWKFVYDRRKRRRQCFQTHRSVHYQRSSSRQ